MQINFFKYSFICCIVFLGLLKKESVAQADTNLIKQLLDTAFQYERSDYDKSKKAAEAALVLAEKAAFLKGISQSYRQLGLLHYDKTEYDKAVALFLKSLEIAEKNKFHDEEARVYLHLGLVYLDKADYDKALNYFSNGKKICEQHGFKKGLPYYTTNMGIVYDLQKKYEKALNCFNEVIALMEQEKNPGGLANAENDVANVYKHQKKYELAKKHYLKALSLLRETNDVYIPVTMGNIAEVDAEMQQYKEALAYLDSAIVEARKLNSPKIIRNCYDKKVYVYQRLNDYKNAFEYSFKARELQDSIFNDESDRNIAEMQTKYETEKKETENRLLKQENELNALKIEEDRKKAVYLFVGLGLTLLMLLVAFYAYRVKIKTNKLLGEQNEQINNQNTTLKRLNTQLIESEEELQQSNSAKEKLLSVISHDISNPVKALANYNAAILNDAENLTKEELQYALAKLNNTITPLQNMVENLLDWSHIQQNGLVAKKEDLRLKKLIEECVFIYKYAAAEKKINLLVDVNDDTMISADKNMMLIIFRNLLNNAIKFSSENTIVKITFDLNLTSIKLEDQGKGMNKTVIQSILSGKNNSSEMGTASEKGSGMGLQLVRDCILAQELKWDIESRIGEGTTFSITI